jgi:putative membrane protein
MLKNVERELHKSPENGEPMKNLLLSLSFSSLLAAPLANAADLSKQDASFLRAMAEADVAEVAAGKMAAQKASSEEVKNYAQHMIDEHSKGIEEGKSLAKAKGQQAPAAPNKKHQAAAKSAKDADVKAAAQKKIPIVQEHLQMAQSAATAGAGGSSRRE